VPISVPALKERKEDIYLLFRKFASDFAEKYRMPAISLDEEAIHVLENYHWPGNVRQLKNITEQISIIEKKRVIDAETLKMYLPNYTENKLPVLFNRTDAESAASFSSEREILYKILFDMKADMNDLKKLVYGLIQTGRIEDFNLDHQSAFNRLYKSESDDIEPQIETVKSVASKTRPTEHIEDTHEVIEESLSLQEKEKELIVKALNKHHGKRKLAAEELGISERTLYRKIKEYDLD